MTLILQHAVAKLPWGHNSTLLDKLKQPEKRLFYAVKSVESGMGPKCVDITDP